MPKSTNLIEIHAEYVKFYNQNGQNAPQQGNSGYFEMKRANFSSVAAFKSTGANGILAFDYVAYFGVTSTNTQDRYVGIDENQNQQELSMTVLDCTTDPQGVAVFPNGGSTWIAQDIDQAAEFVSYLGGLIKL